MKAFLWIFYRAVLCSSPGAFYYSISTFYVYVFIYYFTLVPDGAPQNFSGDSLSETSILLEWDLPAKHLQNGEIVMYQLLYRKLGSNIEEELNVTGLQYEVKGLDMNTDYVFRIRAFTSMGPGPWSAEYRHHTFGKSKNSGMMAII